MGFGLWKAIPPAGGIAQGGAGKKSIGGKL